MRDTITKVALYFITRLMAIDRNTLPYYLQRICIQLAEDRQIPCSGKLPPTHMLGQDEATAATIAPTFRSGTVPTPKQME